MHRGTTPYLRFYIDGYDLTGCTVFLTIEQSTGAEMTWKTGDDRFEVALDEDNPGRTIITAHLTQERTFALRAKLPTRAQVRWIDRDGEAMATEKASIDVRDVLYQEIIAFEEEG